MARKAGQASVSFAPAAAAFQSVRGKACVVDSAIRNLIDVPPRAVAGATKIYRCAGV